MLKKDFFLQIGEIILILAVVGLFLGLFVFFPYQVEGSSMEPNFSHNEYLLMDKLTYRFFKPRRGEVVVLENSNWPQKEFLKRIIGIPGDTVEFKEENIYINGQVLQEDYLPYPSLTYGPKTIKGETKLNLSSQTYLVLGDNRQDSYDSRYFGVIKRETIKGRAILRYLPLDKTKIIQTPRFGT